LKFCCKNQPNNGTAKSLSAEKLERRIRPEFRKICERKSHISLKIYLFFYFCLKHQQNNEKTRCIIQITASKSFTKLFTKLFTN
jgi:hypothetical protein